MDNNILEITYKEGRGHLKLNLSAALPCTTGDMKRICSFLDLSADPAKNAETVYNYISGRVADLKEARGVLDPDRKKQEIAKINAELKKYLSNAAALVKCYGLPEMVDDEAQIKLHAGTVYAIRTGKDGKPAANELNGWTFKKGGYTFSVYKDGKGRDAFYIILLYGLRVAESHKKNEVIAEITPHLLGILNKNAEKLEDAKKHFENYMIAAGYMDPAKIQEPAPVQAAKEEPAKVQEPETVQEPAAKEGAKRAKTILKLVKTVKGGRKMYDVMYSNDSISIRGKGDIKTFPCEYNFSETGAVLLFVTVGTKEDGRKEKQRVKIEKGDLYFGAARAAAIAAGAVDPTEKKKPAKVQEPETVQEPAKVQEPAPVQTAKEEPAKVQAEKKEDAAPVQEPAKVQEPEKKEDTARDPKAARGPVPEKTFIGETIQGNGWKIYFDGETARTRVIFDNTPDEVARAAVENAGFYYSPNMNSWNKKLTFKAYRAAKKLSADLEKIFAA